MSNIDPIIIFPSAFLPRHPAGIRREMPSRRPNSQILFNRRELNQILSLYGRKVAAGEWRDYAIDMGRDRAVFSIFRHASEMPLYRIVKTSRRMRKQGAYSLLAASGHIVRRGPDLTGQAR